MPEELERKLDELFKEQRRKAFAELGRPMTAILITKGGFKKQMALFDFIPMIYTAIPPETTIGKLEDLSTTPQAIQEQRFQFEEIKDKKLIYKEI